MKVLVALAGGGYRALHHLPMLKALKEQGLEIVGISGTSGGAIVATAVAAGLDDDVIINAMLKDLPLYGMRPSFKGGFLSTICIERLAEKLCPDYKLIEQLPLPTWVCATDMLTGQPIYFGHGPLGKLVAASCAVPIIFAPILYHDYLLVDGGLTAIVPIVPLQAYKAEKKVPYPIIGLHCNHYPVGKAITGIRALGERVGQLVLSRQALQVSATGCDLFLSPPNAGLGSMLSAKGSLNTLSMTESYANKEIEKWLVSVQQIR